MKKFEDLTSSELWQLRNEITLNSVYVADYKNSFRFNAKDICESFDGFVDYLCSEAKEDGITDFKVALEKYDNEEFLYTWFLCFDDLSWVKSDIKVFRFPQTYEKTVTWREYYNVEAEEDVDNDIDAYQRRDIDVIYDPEGEDVK